MGWMKHLALLGWDGDLPFSADLVRALAAERLGGEVRGIHIECPSPGCAPDDRSLTINFYSADNFRIYGCNCDYNTARKYVHEKLNIPLIQRDYSRYITQIWSQTQPARGTVVEAYLRSRGIELLPDCLRYHPALWHKETKRNYPGMVAARCAADGSFVTIQRTFLSRDGKKLAERAKKDLGTSIAIGTAIQLAPTADHLLVGEGVETVLSAMQMSGKPGWAAGTSSLLHSVELPAEVKTVTVLVDGDLAGEYALKIAGNRWRREGRTVGVSRAGKNKDFNDLLIEEQNNGKRWFRALGPVA